jgi:hypothetical protein
MTPKWDTPRRAVSFLESFQCESIAAVDNKVMKQP